jgi:hypothetical protein
MADARGDDLVAVRYARRALEVEPNRHLSRLLRRIDERSS